jgi:hypothetical protein
MSVIFLLLATSERLVSGWVIGVLIAQKPFLR